MATLEELQAAFKKAHQAGDTAAAQRLAAAIGKAQGPSAQEKFDELPLWQKPIKALDDLLRIGSDAMTLGGIDYLRMAAGTQPDLETARAATGEARERAGFAGDAAAIGSSLPLMMALPQVTVPAKAGPVISSLGNTALAALEGAGWSGLSALGHGEEVLPAQAEGALWGAGSNMAAGLLGRGLDMVLDRGSRRHRVDPHDLRLAKDRDYNAVEDEGVTFRPSAVDEMLRRVDDATSDAWPGVQQGVIDSRNRAERNLRQGGRGFRRNRTLQEIDKERQNFRRDAVNNPQTTNKSMGLDAIKAIDDFLQDAADNPQWVTSRSGDPSVGLDRMLAGREKNTRIEKLDMVDERLGRARRAAERNLYSGADSTIKSNVSGILDDPKKRSQFTQAEQAQMELVNSGTTTEKALRQVGRFAPGGGLGFYGATALGGLGLASMGPFGAALGLAPGVAGLLSKAASTKMTKNNAERLVDMISSGRDLRKMSTMGPKAQRDLARMLMAIGVTDEED